MFNKCLKLKEIKGINRFNTTNVEDMSGMLQLCDILEYIDLSNFNTNNAKNMAYMFNKCHNLKEIKGINRFNTINVEDMYAMFNECFELQYIDLYNFNTNNVKNMAYMFNKCHKLKYIKGINRFNTTNVKNMYGMFNECFELQYIDLSNFNTTNVTDLSLMFQECFKLEFLNLSNFRLSSAKNISWMFNKCYKLKEIKGIQIFENINNITKIGLFDDCPNLENIPNQLISPPKKFDKKKITVKFILPDQSSCDITCFNTDIFEKIKEKIIIQHTELKHKDIYFLCGGNIINQRVSLAENGIKNDDVILICENDND